MMPKHSLSARRLTALLAVSLSTLAACDSGTDGVPGGTSVSAVTIVTLPNNQTLTNLVPATTRQMFGVPVNSAGNFVDRDVTFESSNNAVFTVSATGLMTAMAGGNAYLRATAAGQTDSVEIRVRYPVGTVTVSNAGLTMRREATQQLTVVTLDTQGATVTGRSITWLSDTPANVAVSATGLAAAQAAAVDASTATISATANNSLDFVTAGVPVANVVGNRLITVNGDATVATVTITGGIADNFYGHTNADVQLTATARSGLGNVIGSAVFVWTSTSAPAATVDATGLVNIVAAGTPTIRATAETFIGSGVNIVGSRAIEVVTAFAAGANVIASIPSGTVRYYAVDGIIGDGFTLATDAGTAGDVDVAAWNPLVTGVAFTSTAGATPGAAGGRVCNSGASGNAESCAITPTIAGWHRIGLLAWTGGGFVQNVTGVTMTYTP